RLLTLTFRARSIPCNGVMHLQGMLCARNVGNTKEGFVRVLLTGGYGCIGAWITRNLLERGDEAWIYDLKQDPRRLRLILDEASVRRVGFVQGDVTDLAGLRRAIEQHGITHLVHLAGLQVPVCRADPLLGAKVNVLGTLAVFEAVRQAQVQVQ